MGFSGPKIDVGVGYFKSGGSPLDALTRGCSDNLSWIANHYEFSCSVIISGS